MIIGYILLLLGLFVVVVRRYQCCSIEYVSSYVGSRLRCSFPSTRYIRDGISHRPTCCKLSNHSRHLWESIEREQTTPLLRSSQSPMSQGENTNHHQLSTHSLDHGCHTAVSMQCLRTLYLTFLPHVRNIPVHFLVRITLGPVG